MGTPLTTREDACKQLFDYVDEVPDDLQCSICTNVFDDPIMCLACMKFFCTACIKEWKKKQNTCPLCRSTDGMGTPSQAITVEVKIGKLVVRCPFINNGCTWTGERIRRDSHVMQCARIQPGCQHGCDTTLRGPALDQHETTCIYRSLQPILRRLDAAEHYKTTAEQHVAVLMQRVVKLEHHIQRTIMRAGIDESDRRENARMQARREFMSLVTSISPPRESLGLICASSSSSSSSSAPNHLDDAIDLTTSSSSSSSSSFTLSRLENDANPAQPMCINVQRVMSGISTSDFSWYSLVFEGFQPTKVIALPNQRILALNARTGGVRMFVKETDTSYRVLPANIFMDIDPLHVRAATYNTKIRGLALLDIQNSQVCVYSSDDYALIRRFGVRMPEGYDLADQCRIYDLCMLDDGSIAMTPFRGRSVVMSARDNTGRWITKSDYVRGTTPNPEEMVCPRAICVGQTEAQKFCLFDPTRSWLKDHNTKKVLVGHTNICMLFRHCALHTVEHAAAVVIDHDRRHVFVLQNRQRRIYRVALSGARDCKIIQLHEYTPGFNRCIKRGMTVDDNGRLYVCDYDRSTVLVFIPIVV